MARGATVGGWVDATRERDGGAGAWEGSTLGASKVDAPRGWRRPAVTDEGRAEEFGLYEEFERIELVWVADTNEELDRRWESPGRPSVGGAATAPPVLSRLALVCLGVNDGGAMLATPTDFAPWGISLRLLSRLMASSALRSRRISSPVLEATDFLGATMSPPARSMLALDCLGLMTGSLVLATSMLMVLL